jgi:hypothetical protein
VDRRSSQGVESPNEGNTSPDPLDVERLLLSLEREPRPPAPIPDERASSNGGRFVAYRGTGRPAQPRTEQVARRPALSELSVFVNATPVPTDTSQRETSTAPIIPQARHGRWAAGPRVRRGVVNAWAMWMGAAVFVAVGVFASVLALSRSHEPQSPAAAGTESIAPVAPIAVVAEPSPVVQATTRPEVRGAAVLPVPPALPSQTRTVPRRTTATPPTASPTEEPRPRKPAFENW